MAINSNDLRELNQVAVESIIVDFGSMVIKFEKNVQLLIQCGFEVVLKSDVQTGHGEDMNSGLILDAFLGRHVINSRLDKNFVLLLSFDNGFSLRITPERNGFESYVLTTRLGICPVMVA